MKTILSSRKHPYIARVGIFLIAIALIAGVVGCGGGGGGGDGDGDGDGVSYTLTMAVSPGGSGTATDVTGASPYPAGTIVNIQAAANPGYRFVNWGAPAGTFGSTTAATTTFTMPTQNVTVTANFVSVYSLTMAVAPAGGGTATDVTNASPYPAGTVVNIQAAANPGYRFVNWSAPAGTFGSTTAATTTFTMPPQNVIVTANFVRVYSLTMAVTPAGGGTANDLTNASPYPAGTVVNIQAVANPPYQFFSWTAPAGTFGNATAAQTTFTMPAQDVTVTAHFVGPTIDHFKGYWANDVTGLPIDEDVYLEDQFGAFNATVDSVWGFANPAGKEHEGNVTPSWNPDYHFTVYDITYLEESQERQVEVDNQFGTQNLTVWGPVALAVPTKKEEHEAPVGLDHYLLYYVDEGLYQEVAVNLTDQFGGDPEVMVYEAAYFANPVRKTYKGEVMEIVNPEVHAVIYWITGDYFETELEVDNQFGEQTLDVYGPGFLAVPSAKIAPPVPPLDHFKCYDVVGAPFLGDYVQLMDQFDFYFDVLVWSADWFCNPVDKWYMGEPTPIVNPNNHLTVYNITPEYQTYWYVEVDNQFGPQQLDVYGPVALAAPTTKEGHGPPKYLDHYLLYDVVGGSPVGATVDLDDQFPGNATEVSVTLPRYFANPVLYKEHEDRITGAWNPKEHLVFYNISANSEYLPGVLVSNQFEEFQPLSLNETGQLLAVPSEKLYYEPY
jgi:hypothetical protein